MTYEIMLAAVASAFLGGAIHAGLSMRKHDVNVHEITKGHVSMLVIDGLIGIITGIAFLNFSIADISVGAGGNAGLLAAGLVGYVGADVLNSLIRIRHKCSGGLG